MSGEALYVSNSLLWTAVLIAHDLVLSVLVIFLTVCSNLAEVFHISFFLFHPHLPHPVLSSCPRFFFSSLFHSLHQPPSLCLFCVLNLNNLCSFIFQLTYLTSSLLENEWWTARTNFKLSSGEKDWEEGFLFDIAFFYWSYCYWTNLSRLMLLVVECSYQIIY